MKVTVTIKEIATGKTKVFSPVYDYEDLDSATFVWTEGNGSCSCNLAELFDGDENNPCVGGREFTAEVEATKTLTTNKGTHRNL